MNLPGIDNLQDVWTNGKVAIVMWERSDSTSQLAVHGVVFP
jgi:hypothetical protein